MKRAEHALTVSVCLFCIVIIFCHIYCIIVGITSLIYGIRTNRISIMIVIADNYICDGNNRKNWPDYSAMQYIWLPT